MNDFIQFYINLGYSELEAKQLYALFLKLNSATISQARYNPQTIPLERANYLLRLLENKRRLADAMTFGMTPHKNEAALMAGAEDLTRNIAGTLAFEGLSNGVLQPILRALGHTNLGRSLVINHYLRNSTPRINRPLYPKIVYLSSAPKPVKGIPLSNASGDMLDWSDVSWFGLAGNRSSWSVADSKALLAHIPEYLQIEQTTKQNGTWLKMPDGSTWQGDPRQWVQMQSKDWKRAFGNSLILSPIYKGGTPQTEAFEYGPKFFTTDVMYARKYGPVLQFYLRANNPRRVDFLIDWDSVSPYFATNGDKEFALLQQSLRALAEQGKYEECDLIQQLIIDLLNTRYPEYMRSLGSNSLNYWKNLTPDFDGVIGIDAGTPYNSTVVIKPNLAKAALGNNGNFNLLDNNYFRSTIPLPFIGKLYNNNSNGKL